MNIASKAIGCLIPWVCMLTLAPSRSLAQSDDLAGKILDSPFVKSVEGFRAVVAPFKEASRVEQETKNLQNLKAMAESQRQVLKRLAELKYTVKDGIAENFFDDAVANLNGEIFAFSVLKTLPDTSDRRVEARQLAYRIDRLANKIHSYNEVVVVPAYISSLAALTLTLRWAGETPQTISAVLSVHVDQVNADLDPAASGVAAQRTALQKKIASLDAAIKAPRSFLIGRLDTAIRLQDADIVVPIDVLIDYEPSSEGKVQALRVRGRSAGHTSKNAAASSPSSFSSTPASPSDADFLPCLAASINLTANALALSNSAIALPPVADSLLIEKKECINKGYEMMRDQVAKDRDQAARLKTVETALKELRDAVREQMRI